MKRRHLATWLGIALLSGCVSQQPTPEGAQAPELETTSQPQQASQGEAAATPEDEQAPKAPAEAEQEGRGEPGEVAVEAPVMGQQEPSPFAQAMREAMVRQQPKLAQCHQSHETGSSQWADCLCQAMCEAPLKLDAPMTKSVKVSWPMISAAIGVYSLVYGPTGEVERCERSRREVSETFWCQEIIESETPKP